MHSKSWKTLARALPGLVKIIITITRQSERIHNERAVILFLKTKDILAFFFLQNLLLKAESLRFKILFRSAKMPTRAEDGENKNLCKERRWPLKKEKLECSFLKDDPQNY